MAKFFSRKDLFSLTWPDEKERSFLLPLIEKGLPYFIENLQADLGILAIDDHRLPCTINHSKPGSCYASSPVSFYGGFSKEKILSLPNPYLRRFLMPFVQTFSKALELSHIDKVIYVNNWLLSTNLHPTLNKVQIKGLIETLSSIFPSYAIAFRSLTQEENDHFFTNLVEKGFAPIAARPVYIVDTKDPDHFKSRMFKSDLKILESTPYTIEDGKNLTDKECLRIAEIYRMLYLDKYSTINPKLTPAFIKHSAESGGLTIKLFKKEGEIDGVLGYYEKYGVMTSPLFGYDTSLPQELGLYRMIATLLSLEAKEKKAILNMSSGAGTYKKLRRAKPFIEYLAVYTRHLSPLRRAPWHCLQGMMNRVGRPLMLRLDK